MFIKSVVRLINDKFHARFNVVLYIGILIITIALSLLLTHSARSAFFPDLIRPPEIEANDEFQIYLPLVFNNSWDCPQAGAWRGKTSKNTNIEFEVENNSGCKISYGTLLISLRYWCPCSFDSTNNSIRFMSEFEIDNKHFEAGTTVVGDFTSPTMAQGTFFKTISDWDQPGCLCTSSGTWSANYYVP